MHELIQLFRTPLYKHVEMGFCVEEECEIVDYLLTISVLQRFYIERRSKDI